MGGFSTGAGSMSHTSTISPDLKSSSASSIEKKLSPKNRMMINFDRNIYE